jgi:outer membrane protein OmpA-like peptidoglycan-associated protein
MKPLIFAAALWAGIASAQSTKNEPWSEEKFSPEEIAASQELTKIQKRIDRGDLPKIQFDFDSDRIRPESYPVLDLIADVLLKNLRVKVRISAHTCIIGTQAYNQALSERRAKSVKTYLVKQGVPPPYIRFKGWGFSKPIADNSTEEGRSKNRRVEFRVIHGDWDSVY